jgi:hypothetical protein
MRPTIRSLCLLLLICANLATYAAAPQSEQPGTPASGTPCLYDFERGEVPDCVRQGSHRDLFIAPGLLKDLPFDSQGLAAVHSSAKGWMYVNRKGKVLITGVAVMDNGADTFHDGLVRFVRNARYGFANRKGQIVIDPVYDGAMNFENGRAAVCKGCTVKCDDSECEHSSFSGGEWIQIDTKGNVVARLHPKK